MEPEWTIVTSIQKQENHGNVTLILKTHKTRYSTEFNCSLRVERTETRPLFHDMTKETQVLKLAQEEVKLERLGQIILELRKKLGHDPNQTEIVDLANTHDLGSRGTILKLLEKGKNSRWNLKTQGNAKTYSPIVQVV